MINVATACLLCLRIAFYQVSVRQLAMHSWTWNGMGFVESLSVSWFTLEQGPGIYVSS